MSHLVAIVGPTAVGKSRLALNLARSLNGEIVSADSRQVYRYMDIGTAKSDRQELSLIPHHLISILNPDELFSLAQYQALAYESINNIQQRNKVALLVGGSGLYVWSVLEGWGIPKVAPDPEFRSSLEKKATEIGGEGLYQELMEVDPMAASTIDRRNVRRVIRALEVYKSNGVPRSQIKEAPPFKILVLGLTADRAKLYGRIDSRVDDMIEMGFVDEVEKLVNMGYDFSLPSMSGIGYKQIGMYLKGQLSLATAKQQTKFETHRFVRHQYSWFRVKDDRIKWFDTQDAVDWEITNLVAKFIMEE